MCVFKLMTEGALQLKFTEFTVAHLVNVQWCFIMALISTSLIIKEVERLFV